MTTPSVVAERVRVDGALRLRGHGHESTHLCFLLAGEFTERGARDRRVTAETLRISPAGDEHDIAFGRAGGECLVIEIASPAAAAVRQREFLESSAASRVARRVAALLRAVHPSPLELELHVLELLACGVRAPTRRGAQPPGWLERMRARLIDGTAEEVSSEVLARETGYHAVYVARAFRQWYGCGPGEFARTLRLDRARSLLLSGSSPARAAAETGFSDQSHLTREMRRRLGCTPGTVSAYEVASVQDWDSPAA